MPPTINVQHCALKSTSKKAQDEAIAAAIKALQSLVDEGNAASVLQLLSNQGVGALKEMLNDIIRPHIFNNETVRVDSTLQFDADVSRLEYRNVVLKWSGLRGGEVCYVQAYLPRSRSNRRMQISPRSQTWGPRGNKKSVT